MLHHTCPFCYLKTDVSATFQGFEELIWLVFSSWGESTARERVASFLVFFLFLCLSCSWYFVVNERAQLLGCLSCTPTRFFFLFNMLWSRHVKPSPAKGEKRKKRNNLNQSLYRLKPFRNQHNVHSMIRCTSKERINRSRET